MWSYLTTDYFINPLPTYVENIPSNPASLKGGNDALLGRLLPLRGYF
jgi:hypothetical protein